MNSIDDNPSMFYIPYMNFMSLKIRDNISLYTKNSFGDNQSQFFNLYVKS